MVLHLEIDGSAPPIPALPVVPPRPAVKEGTLEAIGGSAVDGNGGIGPSAGATAAPKFAPRQTPFPVLPLPHFFPHLAVAESGAP